MNFSQHIALATIGFTASLTVACASPSEAPRTTTIGEATVESHVEGERIVTVITAARSDERMTIHYDRAKREAQLTPKWGPSKVVKNLDLTSDLDQVNRTLGEPAAHGLTVAVERMTAAKGGLAPQTTKPPPPACSNPCFDQCDAKFPDAMQNEACRFGCTAGCSR